ncbi:MAG TPA: TRAP transporter small permease [Usitatibacter sp.]|jgi:TRAP-type C4-dicarboxylate transport system permease small subunit|nr:TRAP transporter small permease [Usitatibacter sp.]
MRQAIDWVDRNVEYVLNVLFYGYIIVIIFTEVVARYVLHSSIVWAEETAIYAFIWMSYLSTARLVRSRAHLAFTLFRDAMPRLPQLLCLLLADACLATVAVVVVLYMWAPLMDSVSYRQTMQGANLPIWIATAAVPVGWLVVLVRVLQRAWDAIRNYRVGRPLVGHALEEHI